MSLLNQITEILSAASSVATLLDGLLDSITEATCADAGLIYLLDGSDGNLTLRASRLPHGVEPGAVRIETGAGIAGWVAEQRSTVILSRKSWMDSRFKRIPSLPEDSFEALMCLPLSGADHVAGVVSVYHREPHEHSADEIAAANLAAALFGSAITSLHCREESNALKRRSELFTAISRAVSSREPQQKSFDEICRHVARGFDSSLTCIALAEDKAELKVSGVYAEKPELVSGLPPEFDKSLYRTVLKSAKPLTINDLASKTWEGQAGVAAPLGVASLLCVPIAFGEGVAGTLNIYTRQRHEFTDEEIDCAAVVGQQIATGIENARLAGEVAELKRALETRKLVERAKGILQQKHRLTEEEAYLRLRNESRRMRRPMRDLAEAIILAEDLSRKGKESRQE